MASAIIIAVIIGTIIEMILPEGNSKKYIKVVIGVYVLFTIVSPVITKVSGKEIKVSDILDLNEYIQEIEETSKMQNYIEIENEGNIMNIYINGIKEDMKAKIEAKGYIVNNIEISIADYETYSIQEVILDVENKEVRDMYTGDSENTQTDQNINSEGEIEKIDKVNEIDRVKIEVSNESGTSNSNNTNESVEENSSDREKNELNITQKQELKEYISSVYEINENNITIN